jgi:hypothetical protein
MAKTLAGWQRQETQVGLAARRRCKSLFCTQVWAEAVAVQLANRLHDRLLASSVEEDRVKESKERAL